MLCMSNVTIGFYSRMPEFLLKIGINKITGLIGKYYDQYTVHKNQRDCIFRELHIILREQFEFEIEDKEKNYSAFHLFQENKLDIHADPSFLGNPKESSNTEEIKFIESHLEKTKVIFADLYQIGQVINSPNNYQTIDFSSFMINNKKLISFILVGYFIISLINLIFLKKLRKKFRKFNRLKLDFIRIFEFNYKQHQILSTKIALIFLFFNLFLFIIINLLKSNIKTETIVVDIDGIGIIDSNDRLKRTNKVLIAYTYDSTVFTRSPKKSFLYQFYNKKVKDKQFIELNSFNSLSKEMEKRFENKDLSNYFIFTNEITLGFALNSLSELMNSNQFIFIPSLRFSENLKIIFMRKNLPVKIKSIIHSRANNYIENGLYSNIYYKIVTTFFSFISPEIKIFRNLDDFINQFSFTLDLEFVNLKKTLLIYMSFNFLILSCFLIDQILEHKRKSRRFNSRFVFN